MMLLIVPLPSWSSTLSATSAASGATPDCLPMRVEAVAENDAGHVRAVTVVVVGLRLAVHEIDELADPLIAVGIGRV